MNLFSPSIGDSSENPITETIQRIIDQFKSSPQTESKEFRAKKISDSNGLKKIEFSIHPDRQHRKTQDRSKERIPNEIRDQIRGVLLGNRPWPMYLWGPPQFGKTSASLFICDYVPGSHFWDFQTICTIYAGIKRGEPTILSFRGKITSEGWREPERVIKFNLNSFINHLRTCPLIVIDEIGLREQPTACQYECLIKVMDERRGLPLIITSNISPADLEYSYDGRIKDRISEWGTVIHFNQRCL